MASVRDPAYDIAGELQRLAPGYVMQREMIDAAAVQYAANGYTPLTAAQAQAICLAQAQAIEARLAPLLPPDAEPYPDSLPPQLPAGLPRTVDSNPAVDGWVQLGAPC